MRDFLPHSRDQGSLLTIYDLKSKYVAFKGSFGQKTFDQKAGMAIGEAIVHIISAWGDLFVITNKANVIFHVLIAKVFKIREINLESKLKILYSNNMYLLAISLCSQSPLTIHNGNKAEVVSENDLDKELTSSKKKSIMTDIRTKYADYLYSKGDFDGSVKQYILTIGSVEPSYVIKNFLSAQRIKNLAVYLQALHDKGLANANHTTLLLNCYTKFGDQARLNTFIESGASFDVETALKVCRSSGFHKQALLLAKKHQLYEWYVKIQIEDLKEYDCAIDYMHSLDVELLSLVLDQYGHILVSNKPQKMTALIINNFLDIEKYNIETFIRFYLNQPVCCADFLEKILSSRFQIHLNLHVVDYNQPPPKRSQKSQETCKKLCDIFLQLSLSLSKTNESQKWTIQVLQILKHPFAIYDIDQALIICKQHNFSEGFLYLYEKMGFYNEIISYYSKLKDVDQLIRVCHQFR